MTMKYRILLCSLFCLCAVTVLRAERVDMLKAGAKVDGKTLNTKLINSTIDRLNANGGGTLFFPADTLSFCLILFSHRSSIHKLHIINMPF